MYKTVFLPYQELFYEYKESQTKNDMQVLQYHDCYELYLMTLGERYLFFNGNCHILRAGDLFLLKPFEMHYTQSLDSELYGRHLLNFSELQLKLILTPEECRLLTDRLYSCVLHLDEAHYRDALFLLQSIAAYSNGNSLSAKLQCSSLLRLLALITECKPQKTSEPDIAPIPADVMPEIMEAIQYINRHYMEQLTLKQLSEMVHLSKYYFCRQFAKTTGATFLEYLNNIRLSKAHSILLDTKLSLTKIAEETGFSSAIQLSRAFHAVYGISPSAFRREKR